MGRRGDEGCGLRLLGHLADKCRRSRGAGENSVDWSGCKHKDTCGPAGSRAGKTSRGGEGDEELEPRAGYIPLQNNTSRGLHIRSGHILASLTNRHTAQKQSAVGKAERQLTQ